MFQMVFSYTNINMNYYFKLIASNTVQDIVYANIRISYFKYYTELVTRSVVQL